MIELWIILAFVSAVLTGVSSIVEKKALMKEHSLEFSVILSIFVFVLSLPFLFFIDFSKIQIFPLMMLFFISIFGAVAFFLAAKSMRHLELSVAVPLLALGPMITSIIGWIFLEESLMATQILGIGLVVAGAYVLETKKKSKLIEPILMVKKSKYIHYILIALVIYSVSWIFDRYLLTRFDFEPTSYLFFANLFLMFHFIVMVFIFHSGAKGIKNGFNNSWKWILLVAVLVVGYRFAQISALKVAYAGLVETIKRLSILFAVIIGGEIFHEHNLIRKVIATIIMLIGIVLIVI